MNIGENISEGIKKSKWIYVEYLNRKNIKVKFWMSVVDINIVSRDLFIYMFRFDKKGNFDTISTWIKLDKIVHAEVLEYTTSPSPYYLIKKIENNIEECEWLRYVHFETTNVWINFDNMVRAEVLGYTSYPKEFTLVDEIGIDINVLKRDSKFPLSDDQIQSLIEKYYMKKDLKKEIKEIKEINSKHSTLIINKFSIDKDAKKYIVCYYELLFDPLERSLVIDPTLRFNSEFMEEGRENSIFNYITIDREVFERNFERNSTEYIDRIAKNLGYDEFINIRPDSMILEK